MPVLSALKFGLCLISGIALSFCGSVGRDSNAVAVNNVEPLNLRTKNEGETFDENPDFDNLPQIEKNMVLNAENWCLGGMVERTIREPAFRVEIGLDAKYRGEIFHDDLRANVARNEFWIEELDNLNPDRLAHGFYRDSLGNPVSVFVFLKLESKRKVISCGFFLDGPELARMLVDSLDDYEG